MCQRARVLLLALAWVLLCALSTPAAAQTISGFERGDCNADNTFNVADMIYLLVDLFANGPASPCEDACDTNDDGALNLSDAILGLDYLFGSNVPLPQPASSCGMDPTLDALACASAPCTIATVVSEGVHTLPSGRVGQTYSGWLPVDYQQEVSWQTTGPAQVIQDRIPYVEYGVPAGAQLPSGLQIDSGTGEIFGNLADPGFHEFTIWARRSNGEAILYDVQLASFSVDDTEIIAGQDLAIPGPWTITTVDLAFTYQHQHPWPTSYPLWMCSPTVPPAVVVIDKPVRVYRPDPAGGPYPVVLFHHGTGFEHDDYSNLLEHVASHGFVCVSVRDPYSFDDYPLYYCWGGHEEAARVLLATREFIADQSSQPGSPLAGVVDSSRWFYAGHSRGGAAAIIASEWDRDTHGVVALQPTDAKGDSWLGNTTRWQTLPETPVLSVSAEQDFDVVFPWAERLLERFPGAATQVTIYGGCHGFTSDTNDSGCNTCTWNQAPPWLDYCKYIERDLQHDLTRQFVTAFLRRHALGDLSVEGILYGDEYQTSALVGVAHRRNLATAIRVDDFEHYPMNSLGYLNSTSGGSVGPGACYDQPLNPPAPITPIQNLIVTMQAPPSQTTFETPVGTLGAPLDASSHRTLKFRIKNADRWGSVDNFGFVWLDFQVALMDEDGDIAALDVSSRLPSTTFHPLPDPSTINVRMKYQRFFNVTLPLSDFTVQNSDLDLDRLLQIDWSWAAGPGTNTTPIIALDDVLFE